MESGYSTLQPQLDIYAQHKVVGTLTFQQQQSCEFKYHPT